MKDFVNKDSIEEFFFIGSANGIFKLRKRNEEVPTFMRPTDKNME